MGFTIFLILLGVGVLLGTVLWAVLSREPKSTRQEIKKSVRVPQRPQVAPKTREDRALPPGMHQVQELLKNNPPPAKDIGIAARAQSAAEENRSLPGALQVLELLKNNKPPADDDSMNIDRTRLVMQKISYEMVGNRHNSETKARFKRDMTCFAANDPMVRLIAARVHELVIDNPGQLQSKIYRHFPEFSKEQVRYGLYFSDELGLIRRKKKGSTYQLFPAGTTYTVPGHDAPAAEN